MNAHDFTTLALIRLYVSMPLDHPDRDVVYSLILKETGREQITMAEMLFIVNN